MDPTKLLEADHRQVEDLFDQIEAAEGAERRSLVDELTTALLAHMELEETVLYPAMVRVTGEEEVVEGENEHEVARVGLAEMLDLVDEPGFGAAREATRAGIAHHVEEEENDLFTELRKDGTVLAEIATPFMAKRLELGLPMGADALEAASTKDELLEEARAAGLDVTTSMTKADLAAGLAETMAATGS
jgi:hemerythrin-like domain-containing protein